VELVCQVKLIVFGLAVLFSLATTVAGLYWREVSMTKNCVQNLQESSLELCKYITDHEGKVPQSNPLPGKPGRCPKGATYIFQRVHDGGLSAAEDGWGFKISCPEVHRGYSLEKVRLVSDLVDSRIPIQGW